MRSLNRSMRIGLNGGIRVLMCTVDRVYCHGNKKVHGKSGSIHYPRIVLPGKDDLPSGSWASGVPIKERYSDHIIIFTLDYNIQYFKSYQIILGSSPTKLEKNQN